ncbi:MAG: hypothetical protein NTX50_07285 [Candidatus Sumerlaeota bacterium]|nr:hypothetical protein [Candidatus Sumerlaeota bacterium]
MTAQVTGQVYMDRHTTVTIPWTEQFYLLVDSPRGAPAGSAWYNAGTNAPWSVTSPIYIASDDRWVANPASGNALMANCTTVTVAWGREFLLSAAADPAVGGVITGDSGWQAQGASVTVSVTPKPGYVFTRWIGDVPAGMELLPSLLMTMDQPRVTTAILEREVGTIVIAVAPSSGTWQLSGPEGLSLSDSGSTTIIRVTSGDYTIAWTPMNGWDTPSTATQTLTRNGVISFIGVYQRQLGTVVVSVEPDAATWSFTDGDGAIHNGAGDAAVTSVPTGNITLTWNPLTQYLSPAPNPETKALAKNGQAVFNGVYISDTGMVVIAPGPVSIASSITWQLTGPGGFSLQDKGSTTILSAPTGAYSITWLPFAGWDAPSTNTKILTIGSSITLAGVYARQLGTVVVVVDPKEGLWSFVDSAGVLYEKPATSNPIVTIPNVPIGPVTLTWKEIPNYFLPVPATVTQILAKNQTLTFLGVYSWPGTRITDDWDIVYKINGRDKAVPTSNILSADGRGIILPANAGALDTLDIKLKKKRVNPSTPPTYIDYIQSSAGGFKKLGTQAMVRQVTVAQTLKNLTAIGAWVEGVSVTTGGLGIVRMTANLDSQLTSWTAPVYTLPLDDRTRFAVANINVAGDAGGRGKASITLNGVLLQRLFAPKQNVGAVLANTKVTGLRGQPKRLSFGGILRSPEEHTSHALIAKAIASVTANGGPVAPFLIDGGSLLLKVNATGQVLSLSRTDKRFFSGDICPFSIDSGAKTLQVTAKGGIIAPGRIFGGGAIPKISSKYLIFNSASGKVVIGGRVGAVPDKYSDAATSSVTMQVRAGDHALAKPDPNILNVYADLGVFGVFLAGVDDSTSAPLGSVGLVKVKPKLTLPSAITPLSWWGHIVGKGYSKNKITVKPAEGKPADEFIDVLHPTSPTLTLRK